MWNYAQVIRRLRTLETVGKRRVVNNSWGSRHNCLTVDNQAPCGLTREITHENATSTRVEHLVRRSTKPVPECSTIKLFLFEEEN